MHPFATPHPSRKWLAALVATLLCLASPPPPSPPTMPMPPRAPRSPCSRPRSPASTISSRFPGIVIPREETSVRPDRPGLKVAEILADAGDSVTAGQTLARLTLPEGGTVQVQAPVAGLIASSYGRDRRGGVGQGRGAVFHHRAQRIRPGRPGADPGSRQARGQPDRADQDHRRRRGRRQGAPGGVRRSSPTASSARSSSAIITTRRLLVNSSGRALIKTGQSCGVVGAAHRGALQSPPAPWCRWCAARGSRPSGSRSA